MRWLRNMVDTDLLLLRISEGDHSACEPLLARYETRLRQTITARMDRRASARFGISDVLQETLTIAVQRLPQRTRWGQPLI
jgi:DNA-directed RNA polymerase specialized sigma24 family protein